MGDFKPIIKKITSSCLKEKRLVEKKIVFEF